MLAYFQNLSELKKTLATIAGLYGIYRWPVLINVSPGWEFIIKGFGGVIFLLIGVFGTLAVTSVYKKVLEPKWFKDKNKKDEKESETDNEKVA